MEYLSKLRGRLFNVQGQKNNLIRILAQAMIYLSLIVFGFVFIYPIIFVFFRSFMAQEDLFNPLVNMIPSTFTLENYTFMFSKINLAESLFYSATLAIGSSLLQAVSCGLMGYGLSRFEFKMKKVYLVLVVICFIIPNQVLMIPTYLGYSELKIIGSPLAFFIPAALGQGLKSPIFILIFFSFFNTIPKALDEAAQIDGASPLKIFIRVAVPLSMPAVVLTLIFSVVWYWNEGYLTALYIGDTAKTLSNQMGLVLNALENTARQELTVSQVNVPVRMAANFITLIPLLAFYIVLQKQFVESVDKTGITGE